MPVVGFSINNWYDWRSPMLGNKKKIEIHFSRWKCWLCMLVDKSFVYRKISAIFCLLPASRGSLQFGRSRCDWTSSWRVSVWKCQCGSSCTQFTRASTEISAASVQLFRAFAHLLAVKREIKWVKLIWIDYRVPKNSEQSLDTKR